MYLQRARARHPALVAHEAQSLLCNDAARMLVVVTAARRAIYLLHRTTRSSMCGLKNV